MCRDRAPELIPSLGEPTRRVGALTLIAGVEDYQVALATYRAACQRWPGTPITLRQGARVHHAARRRGFRSVQRLGWIALNGAGALDFALAVEASKLGLCGVPRADGGAEFVQQG